MLSTSEIKDLVASKNSKLAKEVLNDFWICSLSRQVSLLGRREVLTGKAKFGILGDGKELPQVVLAKVFKKGDWRSGYYRDQTAMFALGVSTIEDFFAQLYADNANDPFSGGRQMNAHFATPIIDKEGNWLPTTDTYNISSDISCTGGQMARGFGLAFASKKYRESGELEKGTGFSDQGNEVTWVTIGDASTSEGIFWETINAMGVSQVPMVVSVWDDGYGISVPKKFQTTKSSISEILEGFRRNDEQNGIEIIKARGWNYQELIAAYEKAEKIARIEHVPVLVHVEELTQPQGHSTSGSHERYKTQERLAWEKAHDCLVKMKEWIISSKIADKEELEQLEKKAVVVVRKGKERAWRNFNDPILARKHQFVEILDSLESENAELIGPAKKQISTLINATKSEILSIARKTAFKLLPKKDEALHKLIVELTELGEKNYDTNLYSEDNFSALNVASEAPSYMDSAPMVNGYQVLNSYFDELLAKNPKVFAFGEDVGQIGDVNQGFAGLQSKYGVERVFDTGIREWSIMGQAIGMSMRGLRPIAEIQYLDYLIYGLEPLSDDLSTLRYRTNGIQAAPAIIRTRGHRLEGIWHAGSPMGLLINSLRGMYIGVPRNMTQAVGMYNTALESNDPVLVIECLNGYRLKEKLPENLTDIKVPFGVPEVIQEGTDVTCVSYGSTLRLVEEAGRELAEKGISVEIIDIQTLLPFDLESRIVASLEKTNKLCIVDEDVPGGASGFILQQILERQGGYEVLDAAPLTITGKAHRPAYGSDGDYFSKPSADAIVEEIYDMMHQSDPSSFPL